MSLLFLYITIFSAILFLAGCIADYILPLIPALDRWLMRLPMMQEVDKHDRG